MKKILGIVGILGILGLGIMVGGKAWAANIYVPGSYTTIQAAINAATTGDTVWVADGTWTGTGNKNLSWSEKHITVRSVNGSATCIIDCQLDGRAFNFDNTDQTPEDIIDGFTIINGSATSGGAFYITNGSPTIRNCTIKYNRATGDWREGGGAIYCGRASPSITNCTISNNTANYGGGIYCSSSSPAITNCIILNNTAANYGGGIYCYSSSPSITNCTISGNSGVFDGGGIYYYDCYSCGTITNCIITWNYADWGGGIYCSHSSPSITNCVISKGGAGGAGAGIYCYDSFPSIINCVISKCIAWKGGGIYCSRSSPSICFSDFWSNTPQNYYGCSLGIGCISTDPQFIGGEDYHLGSSSPCIDAGSNTAPAIPSTDADGNPRVVNGIVDMGAYEYQRTPTTGSLTITSTPAGANIYLDGTSTGTITPAILTGIISGTHTVTLTKADYYDWTGMVTVIAEATTEVTATLPLITGSISITSTPTGTNILLDGVDIGTVTPSTLTSITPGDHTIKLTKAGYYDWFGTITITAEATTDVTATLTLIDKISPTTTDNAPTSWQNATVTVTLTATDPTPSSGVARTYYSVNQGTWTVGTVVVISSEGTNTLSYYSVDNAGNTETTKTAIVRIDRVSPITTDNAPAGWYNSVITLIATDPISGVVQTYYTTDGSTPTINSATETTINLTTDGTYTIKYFSIDNAGNAEAVKTAVNIVMIDKTPPVITIIPANGAILLSTQTTVVGSITDISQSAYGTLTINGTSSAIDIAGDSFVATTTLCYGKNIIVVIITDKAGNISSKTVFVEVVTTKEPVLPNQTGETETADGTRIETLKNYPGTMTITINNKPKEANFAVADQNLPKGIDISQLAEAVREFKLFNEEDAIASTTTTGRFRITISYPVTVPDNKAMDLRIFWMDPSDNKWKLVGGTVDTINHTVTVEVEHLSIFRVAFYTFIASDLTNIHVYPNPFKPYDGNSDTGIPYDGSVNSGIIFDSLTEDCTLKIFNLAGELVTELSGTGKVQWNAKTKSGKEVASGVYIYLITDKVGNKKTGKFTIIR